MAKKRNNKGLYILLIVLILLVAAMGALLGMMTLKSELPTPVEGDPIAVTEPVIVFDKNDPNLILVNKENPVDEDYVPAELVYIDESMRAEDRAPQYQRMQPEAAGAFEEMVNAAAEEGLTIKVTTAYRPYEYQADLYYYYLAVKGEEWTKQYSAEPGTSEHQTGLAVDVSSPDIGYALDVSFGDTDESAWLAEHAHEYGFILRFQEGDEEITGYSYEPWHFRYVGKEAAAEIYSRDITLEEFLEGI